MTLTAEVRGDLRFDAVGEWVGANETLLLDGEERAALIEEWIVIGERERTLDDRLAIGIVGGTGVGKSMFINALARREISRSGDRRPTTDRVVVYRHASTDLPEAMPRDDLAIPQVEHDEDEIERVLILDFPDFDSVEAEHRDILTRHIPTLDVLFVIVDDVKYADRRLFELLRELPQNSENLYFVLNKTDALETRYRERATAVVEEMLADFRAKLSEHARWTVSDEQLLALSSRLELHGGHHGFAAVRSIVSSYREEKRRREAKRLNLEETKSDWLARVRKSALSARTRRAIDRVQECVTSWKGELDASLERLCADVLTEAQRRTWRSRRLGDRGSTLPFPLSAFFASFARATRPKRTKENGESGTLSREDLAVRLRRHYQSSLEAFANLESTVGAELDGAPFEFRLLEASPVDVGKSGSDVWVRDLAETWEKLLSQSMRGAETKPRWWVHAPAVFVVLIGLVSRFVSEPSEGGAVPREEAAPSFLERIADGIAASFQLGFLAALVASVFVVYGIVSSFFWSHRAREIDVAMSAAQSSVRDAMAQRVRGGVDELERFAARLDSEWSQLEALIEGRAAD